MKNPWLFIPEPRPEATLRLFCFHHAGGSASLFYGWPKRFPRSVEIVPVQLPGRANRLSESFLTSVPEIVDTIEATLTSELGKPFALFGHSMGGLVAFELARKLESQGKTPRHLFVSGVRAAPLFPRAHRKFAAMSDAELVSDMKSLGGTPDAMFEHEELLALILPVIRADYRAIDAYRFREGTQLSCPVTAMAGLSDAETPEDTVAAWSALTSADFTSLWYAGDHFFIQSQEEHVTRDILGRLALA